MNRLKLFIINLLSLVIFLILPSPALAATLSLSPASGTINSGCSMSVQVHLNTTGASADGADVILLYNPDKLKATSIVDGTLFSDYPTYPQYSPIDTTQGKVSIYALASNGQPFSGNGVLATVNFDVLPSTGTAEINFDFDSNDKTKTTDSNIIEQQTLKDVLDSVTNGSYTLSTGSCTGSATSTNTTTTTTSSNSTSTTNSASASTGNTATKKTSGVKLSATSGQGSATDPSGETLPESGTTENTLFILMASLVFMGLGIFGIAKRL